MSTWIDWLLLGRMLIYILGAIFVIGGAALLIAELTGSDDL